MDYFPIEIIGTGRGEQAREEDAKKKKTLKEILVATLFDQASGSRIKNPH